MHDMITRRGLLSLLAAGGWLGRLALHAAGQPAAKSCILLWMSGGPSHIDTFDPKPDAPDRIRGEFKAIDTSVPGIQISEHFPRFARLIGHAAVLRSMSTVESDHQLATYHVHTGYQKRAGEVAFPSLGALASRELGERDSALPSFVCIGTGARHATRSGFLGPEHQPLDVNDAARGAAFLEPFAGRAQLERQYALVRRFDSGFQQLYRSEAARAHSSAKIA